MNHQPLKKETKCTRRHGRAIYQRAWAPLLPSVMKGGEKKNLIKKDKVRGEDCSLNVGCSGRCVAGGCVCFGDESESELRRLN